MVKSYISQQIRYYRKRCGMTQQQVANHVGRSAKTIEGWELGHSHPDANALVSLCQLFECHISDLFGVDGPTDVPLPGYIRTPISFQENELLELWRAMDESGRQRVRMVLKYEADTSPKES
jgi:DNA-binding XRE family transcriptional regulator